MRFMGTSAAVIEEKEVEGKKIFRGIYVHWDGYPRHTLRILEESYMDKERVSALIDLGDLSSIDKDINPSEGSNHSYKTPEEGVCVAYHRDRQERRCNIVVGESLKSVLSNLQCNYTYVYQDGKWGEVD